MSYRPKVVIIGGGFAGLNAALSLKTAPVDLLLIDRTNHHLFQPLLYQVAAAALSPADIARPLREIMARQKNASIMMEEVVAINKQEKKVILQNGTTISFDYLIVAIGARHSYFGHSEWETFAPGLKTLSDALTLRNKILLSFENAENAKTHEEAKKFLRFVVVGGGPTGVEMAGAIAEIAKESLFENFHHIKPQDAQVYLVEGLPHILSTYPEELSLKAEEDLRKLGVTVLTNKRVTFIDAKGIRMGDESIETYNVIWAAGNQASPILRSLEVPMDKQGRVIVEPDLTIPGDSKIFVVGDAACAKDEEGKVLPGIAPVAIQQGRYVAKLIKRKLENQTTKSFHYRDKGSLATIGKAKAVGVVGKLKVSGFFAWLAWSCIHIVYLINFKSRFIVLSQWLFWLLTGHRNVKLISKDGGSE